MLEVVGGGSYLEVGALGLLETVLVDSGVVVIYGGSLDMLFLYPGSFWTGGGGICGGTGVYTMVSGGQDAPVMFHNYSRLFRKLRMPNRLEKFMTLLCLHTFQAQSKSAHSIDAPFTRQ